MQLVPGVRLGPYEIVERAGAGGMGEVYRARDTRLPRDVAIKIVSSEFASRFHREAKAISALNHPNICTLYDIGSENGIDYLVLEYCEGQTLADKLERGALSIDQAVEYGIQIAEALSRAHRAGIVHRDLKPSNIMLTKSGVKLLDFSLAKQQRPTTDEKDTTSLQGQLVGTIQYMAPEVLNGQEADVRSDIFALGLVLYEMLTGKPAFSGTSKASVIASILEHEPPALSPETAPALQHVVSTCLAKNADDRWESARDVAEELRWARERPPIAAKPSRRVPLTIAVAVLALMAATVTILVWRTERKTDRIVRFSIPVIASDPTAYTIPMIAISPDGSRVAYASIGAGGPIYVRSLESQQAIAIAGTERGVNPFFSPDGQWIAFVEDTGGPGRLIKVRASDGASQSLFRGIILGGRGAVWAPDGTIYFSPGSSTGLWKVPANGGRAEEVTRPDPSIGENSHRWPEILPDGKHLLFTIRTNQITSFDEAKIAVLTLSTGKWKVVLDQGSFPRYVAGRLVFGRGGSLYAVLFDLKSLMVSGSPKKIAEGVLTYRPFGTVHYAVSSNGDLAYLPGGIVGEHAELVFVDTEGRTIRKANLNFAVDRASLSPDGGKLAISAISSNNDIWLYDLESGSATRFSFEPGDEVCPVWTPDGARVIYTTSEPRRIVVRNADGSGTPEELLRIDGRPRSCSPDGNFLMYDRRGPNGDLDLWLLPLKGDRRPRPFLQTPFNEIGGVFSPDGKWVAYVSDESGSNEVYIRSASPGGGRWQVSIGGGDGPRWSHDRKRLYYAAAREHAIGIHSVEILMAGNEIRSGKPRLIVSLPDVRLYEVTKDGLLVVRNVSAAPMPEQMTVVLNWSRDLSANR